MCPPREASRGGNVSRFATGDLSVSGSSPPGGVGGRGTEATLRSGQNARIATASPADAAVPRSFTFRAITAGAVGSLIIAVGAVYGEHVIQGSYVALDFSTPGAVFLFFVLAFLVNVILGALRRRWALNAGELIVAYIMMIVASAIPTMGLTSQLLPIITAPYYYATTENKWAAHLWPNLEGQATIHLGHWSVSLPRRGWLTPTDTTAIEQFYEGLSPGQHIPWGVWVRPLIAWTALIFALYLAMMCMMVILRRQWVERERLAFPLTQLPLEMVRGADTAPLTRFFRNPVMWIGFGIPFVLGSLKGLHYYVPAVPSFRDYTQFLWFRDTATLVFRLSFPMLGFFYLVNLDTLFSLWFFNVVFQIVAGYINIVGTSWRENLGIYGSLSPFFAHLGMGAMIALVGLGLWTARRHLRDVFAKAWRRDPAVDDSSEMLSYRAAFWGMIGGLLFMWAWLWWSGLPPVLGTVFLAGAFVLFIGLTRVVVESGVAEAVASTISAGFVVSSFGSKAFGGPGLTSLAINYVWSSDIRTYVMASTANSLRMADVTRGSKRPLFWVIWLAIIISLAASIWITLLMAYSKGGINLNNWFFVGGPPAPYKWAVEKLTSPSEVNWMGWAIRILGFGIMWLLMIMRQNFLWWPLHPIGFVIGSTWIMNQLWLTCLIAWFVKGAIVRFGGLRAFNFFRPAFLGMILGQFTCNGMWLIIDGITGSQKNVIFWI
jgi:hypothetical protein